MTLSKKIEQKYLSDEETDIQTAVKQVIGEELDGREQKIEEKLGSQVSVSLTDMGRLELIQELRNQL